MCLYRVFSCNEFGLHHVKFSVAKYHVFCAETKGRWTKPRVQWVFESAAWPAVTNSQPTWGQMHVECLNYICWSL